MCVSAGVGGAVGPGFGPMEGSPVRAVLWGGWKWGAQQRPEAASSLTEEAWLGHLVGGGVSGDGERGPG